MKSKTTSDTAETGPFAPRQERSRAMLERLLNATIAVLDQGGLDGATIPRIAAAAKVAPASVYRRFADKDALLRAAFLHALGQSNRNNQKLLEDALLRDSLAATAERLVVLLFEQYRRHPHLLRALSHFIDADHDQEFIGKAQELVNRNIDLMVAVLLRHRDEIADAVPEDVLRFAVLNISCSIETFALDPHALWHAAPAIDETTLATRLAHGFVACLKTAAAATV